MSVSALKHVKGDFGHFFIDLKPDMKFCGRVESKCDTPNPLNPYIFLKETTLI